MHTYHVNDFPHDLSHLIDTELRGGERIMWMGQPIPSQLAWRSGIWTLLLGIPWTAFVLFWMAGASGFKIPDFSGGFDFFPLFGIPFLLVGFGMLSSPYWMLRKARKTAYVVTDRRAVIFSPGPFGGNSIRSFEPERLKDIRRVQKPDGTGDLIFEQTWTSNKNGFRQSIDHGFFAIAGVREVEEIITRLSRGS